MKKVKNKIYLIYMSSVIIFVLLIFAFTLAYNYFFVREKMNITTNELVVENLTIDEAFFKMISLGYDIRYLDDEVGSQYNLGEFKNETVNTVINYKNSPSGPYVVINGKYKIVINQLLLSDYKNDLMIIFLASAMLYFIITFFGVRYFINKIVSPLSQINYELYRISNYNFDGELDIKSNDEIKMLANNVENIKVSLKSYTNNRKALVSALIHELKSPVSTISSVLQLNKLGHELYDDETTRGIIEENIEVISSITKMSLDIFEKQHIYKLAHLNINLLVDEQIDYFKPTLDDKDLDINIIADNVFWNVDLETFKLILSNIFSNICKYSQDNSVVEIVISDRELMFSNYISKEFTSGTGKGLKLSESLLDDMGIKLDYYADKSKYFVKISY